jgi:HSP20 family molecular chaperone IbpA
MSRVFEFPCEINTDEVEAHLEFGVLKVRAPKAAAGRHKEIRIHPRGSGTNTGR